MIKKLSRRSSNKNADTKSAYFWPYLVRKNELIIWGASYILQNSEIRVTKTVATLSHVAENTVAIQSDGSNVNSSDLFCIQNQNWHKSFTRLLDHEIGRTAELGLRKLQEKAAIKTKADPAAFRKLLICLLEEVVFRIPLNRCLDTPRDYVDTGIAEFRKEIKANEKLKRELGPPVRVPRGKLQLFQLEVKKRKVRKLLDELLEYERDQLRCLRKCCVTGDSIAPDKKDTFAITRLCIVVLAFTGHWFYPQISEILEIASGAKGDIHSWRPEMIRKIVSRSLTEEELEALDVDLLLMRRQVIPGTVGEAAPAELSDDREQ